MFSQTFIQEIAIKTNLPETEVQQILKAFWTTFKDVVLASDQIQIPGMGVFEIRHLNSLKEIDEKTGASILTPPKDMLEFTPEN